MKKCWLCVLAASILLAADAGARTYYVSTTGNDNYPGTIDSAFATLYKPVGLVNPGDTIYVRGGTYAINSTVSISRSGAPGNLCSLLAYPGERVLIDCSAMAIGSSNRGIKLNGSYWHIKGFDVYHAGDNGMIINGSYNIVEFCSFFENSDSGLQLAAGASYNRIVNCDSYYNADPSQGNADGFAPKLDVGTGNYFYGCRSWQNSDDGWDGYMRPSNGVTTTLENCWTFQNGYLKSGAASTGNGNGFKMGGSDNRDLEHNMILERCVAFDNRVKGFDQNNNRGSMTLYNCTSYRNGTNYSITLALDSGRTATLVNCVSAGSGGVTLASFVVQQTDSWLNPFSVSDADFASVDTTGVRGPRSADGSLPDLPFLHLVQGSDLVDGGTDVGLLYSGSAPDLGAFEVSPPPRAGLVAFEATVENVVNVRLAWITLSEQNVDRFVVQRRLPSDTAWTDAPGASVAGQGSSSDLHQYSVVDSNVPSGTWWYRVEQIDGDSSTAVSDAIIVNVDIPVAVDEPAAPTRFALSQNFPNPFNPSTEIRFWVGKSSPVVLEVYNVLGQKVATLFNAVAGPGRSYTVRFTGADLASGVYFCRMRSGAESAMRKMLLVR